MTQNSEVKTEMVRVEELEEGYHFRDGRFKLKRLVDTITKEGGVKDPIKVWRRPGDGQLIIVDGHRRKRALEEAIDSGANVSPHIEVIVLEDITTPEEARWRGLQANVAHRKVNDNEVGVAVIEEIQRGILTEQEIANGLEMQLRTLRKHVSVQTNAIDEVRIALSQGYIDIKTAFEFSEMSADQQEEKIAKLRAVLKTNHKDFKRIWQSIKDHMASERRRRNSMTKAQKEEVIAEMRLRVESYKEDPEMAEFIPDHLAKIHALEADLGLRSRDSLFKLAHEEEA